MSGPGEQSSEPPAKRRKVRKGTRSCWECRRRKIKCQFNKPEDAICIGCKQRGTTCRSQEFADDGAAEPGHKSEPPLARRLDRLEQMMERLVDRIVPDEADMQGTSSNQPQVEARRSLSGSFQGEASAEHRESSADALDTTAASEGPIAALLSMRHESVHRRGPSESRHIPTPASTSVLEFATSTATAAVTPPERTSRPLKKSGSALLPPLNKHFWVCNTLRNVVPSQAAVDAILTASPGAPYVVAMCYSDAERRIGRPESPSSVSNTPTLTAHPLILAKRALQVLICIQQLPPEFDWDALEIGAAINDTMNRLTTTVTLVTSNDELIGYAEGIECLILQGFYQANGGNLRKAWITARRALSLAQMIGIDKGHSAAFRSCDPNINIHHRTSPAVLWSKVVSWERCLSLLLGLPIGSQGIVLPTIADPDSPMDRLERSHTALSARIGERNASHQRDPARHLSIYALTQEIDLELEATARDVPPEWWDQPHLDVSAPQNLLWDAIGKMLAQIHHFTLVLLLHVPYMLRDIDSPRYDYSKTACTTAARDLLSRFLIIRKHSVSAYVHHLVDYAGLIASMTLCLSYLSKRRSEVWEHDKIRQDILLLDNTKSRMDLVAHVSGDRLSREAVCVIDQLTPLVRKAAGDTVIQGETQVETPRAVHFNVPFMGAISITMPCGTSMSPPEWQGGHRRHPSSATGALERMAIGSPTQQHRPVRSSIETDTPVRTDIGFLNFAPYDDRAPLRPSAIENPVVEQQTDLLADGEEWALQGVDAAFWSLLEGSGV
ncbi:hypothetical protein N0V93_000016 [Gnomoniopsis smithogilvyi]|uniref:Zn(2)-C6 fungal-type domain-containing protein n=1 Tax=Gnomoniopsis smithogilvyi TaxID=1191159 RepID=A0A9W8Z364_9PEZI|nr:hypothetical protein N0V93_000016 [Gnomoniopsis smithogilvyi]